MAPWCNFLQNFPNGITGAVLPVKEKKKTAGVSEGGSLTIVPSKQFLTYPVIGLPGEHLLLSWFLNGRKTAYDYVNSKYFESEENTQLRTTFKGTVLLKQNL